MPAGRPTKYKAEYVKQARKLCHLGATDAELAAFFEVDEDTINEWKKVHPEFSESLKVSKEEYDGRIERKLAERAMGYSHGAVKIFNDEGTPMKVDYVEHYPPDTTACIFWLKNRQPSKWRDRQEVTGADGAPILPVIELITKETK